MNTIPNSHNINLGTVGEGSLLQLRKDGQPKAHNMSAMASDSCNLTANAVKETIDHANHTKDSVGPEQIDIDT